MLPPLPPLPETFAATLVHAAPLTPRVRRFVFERADGRPFHFTAGQWVSVVLPVDDERGRPLRRSYSVASAPDGSARFELAITRVDDGPASDWLHRAAPGTQLEVKGPQGHFVHRPDVPSLLVATGSGVAPFRGYVHEAVKAGRRAPLWVLLGAREVSDLLFADEWAALEAAHPHVRFFPTLTRPPSGWAGLQGRVQAHVPSLWEGLAAYGPPHLWACGVREMVLGVRDTVRALPGVTREQVHVETY